MYLSAFVDPFIPIAHAVSLRRDDEIRFRISKLRQQDFRHSPAFVQTIRGLFYDLGPDALNMYYLASMAMSRALDNDRDKDDKWSSEGDDMDGRLAVLTAVAQGLTIHPTLMSGGTIDDHRFFLRWCSLMSTSHLDSDSRVMVESMMVRCMLRQSSCDLWRSRFFQENTESLFRFLSTVPDERLPSVLRALQPVLEIAPRSMDMAEKSLTFVNCWKQVQNCDAICNGWAHFVVPYLRGPFPLPHSIVGAFVRPRLSDRRLQKQMKQMLTILVSRPRGDHVDAVIVTMMGIFDKSLRVDPNMVAFVLTEVLLAPALGSQPPSALGTYQRSSLCGLVPDALDLLCERLVEPRAVLTSLQHFAHSWGLLEHAAVFLRQSVFLTLVTFCRRVLHLCAPEHVVVMLDALAWVDRFRVDSLEYRALIIQAVRTCQDDASFRAGLRHLVVSALMDDPLRAHFLIGTLAHERFLEAELPQLWPSLKFALCRPRDDARWTPVADRVQQLLAFAFRQHVDAVRGRAEEYLADVEPADAVVVGMLEDLDLLESQAHSTPQREGRTPPPKTPTHPSDAPSHDANHVVIAADRTAPPSSDAHAKTSLYHALKQRASRAFARLKSATLAKEEVLERPHVTMARNAKYRIQHSPTLTDCTLQQTGRFVEFALWPEPLRQMDVEVADNEKTDLVLSQLHAARMSAL
eukprot:GEMP01015808.1.p1 GENE.GEMP01015808.1~~GEMP01015808.1.p1  ORF type:complete len:690 (+),score=209.89 GEMP01015808.1:176-2245(+)